LEESFEGSQGSTLGCRAQEEEKEDEGFLTMCAVTLLLELHIKYISMY
jgi:hypothetical protein